MLDKAALEYFGYTITKAPPGDGVRTPITPSLSGRTGPTVIQGGPSSVRRVPGDLLAPVPDRNAQFNPGDTIDEVTDNNFFSPQQPVQPFGPPNVMYPREWDYPTGINLDIQPGRLFVMKKLREASKQWGIISQTIEERIDQMLLMPWTFGLKGNQDEDVNQADPRIKFLDEFFQYPDKKHAYEVWMRMIFRDRYTIDAATCYIWRSADGFTPYALEPIDGATIKPLVDNSGRTPDYPSPAYQQIIKGLPMTNFTERELIYSPARPRTEDPMYGYSEVEQVFIEIMEGIRKAMYQLGFWEEGTLPDLMIGVPETWTPEQIASWQASFDALMSGNIKLKSRARFVPGGMKPFEIKGSAGELLKSEYDEWLTRIVRNAFRLPATPFIKELNRSTSDSAKETSDEMGLYIEMVWWKSFVDRIIKVGFGWSDIEYVWQPKPALDALQQSTMITAYVSKGIKTINEARRELGLDGIPGGDVAMVYIGTGAIPVEDLAAGTILDLQQQSADAATTSASQPAAGPSGGAGGSTKGPSGTKRGPGKSGQPSGAARATKVGTPIGGAPLTPRQQQWKQY